MIYSKQPAGTSPAKMLWIFERTNTKTSVAVKYNLSLIEPQVTPEYKNLGIKITRGLASSEEIEKWQILLE